MSCRHPNIRLTISWGEQAFTTGPDVETYRIQPASLIVRVVGCPDCGLTGNVYTSMDNWEDRWPNWLKDRVRKLAYRYDTIRRAVRACLPGLVPDIVR